MIAEVSLKLNSTQLPDAISKEGDRRFEALFKVVSKAQLADLEDLRAQAIATARSIDTTTEKEYWSQLASNYLLALHKKMELLERVQAFGIPDTESLLSLCTTAEHIVCVKNLVLLLPKKEHASFVKVLESFCMSFQEPMKAVDAIISHIVPYPKESRCALIRAFRCLFGNKFLVKASDISLIIPHVYMLLDSQDLLQSIGEQSKTFEEIQSRLTK